MTRRYELPRGREIELDDADFRALIHSNRERVLSMLKVRRGRPEIALEVVDGQARVRLRGDQEPDEREPDA